MPIAVHWLEPTVGTQGRTVAVRSPGTQTEANSGAGSLAAVRVPSPTKTGSVDLLDAPL